MHYLVDLISTYYSKRNLKWPSVDEAMQWMETEVGEVYEILLARDGGWVRNNPSGKPAYSKEALAEELGDAVMMLIVAGIVEGVDVVDALEHKIYSKLQELK